MFDCVVILCSIMSTVIIKYIIDIVDSGFSLSDSNTNSRSIRVRCSNRLCFCTANSSARNNGVVDIPAVLSTSQRGGGTISARAATAS